jgi:hypothetical protein
MDPATLAMLIGGGQAAGGLIGSLFGSGDNEAALRAIQGIDTSLIPNAYDQEDPAARQKMLGALEYLYNQGAAGGMDPQSRAALAQAQAQTGAAEQGARGALQQNAAARGVGGSGVEFLGTLANQQGAAQRNALAGVQAVGDARTRALQAMHSAAGVGGQIRGDDSRKLEAANRLQMFNRDQQMRKAQLLAGAHDDEAQRKAQLGAGVGSGLGALTGYFKSAF